ncbi:hypothetical protein VTN77DRAFT_564 [Rasamsonia byssochlamydoides]|uniref:uncharacterized protein n=1 Tax=Rasamsonia byssochlamydoides TaxID=89139 RepID=UPI0037422CE0
MAVDTYDAIIIGSGQGGTPLANAFATAGRKTALIEREHLGGCCTNEGCTPTKTIVASGRVAYLTRRGQDFGVHTNTSISSKNDVIIDLLTMRQRRRHIVSKFRGRIEGRAVEAGVDVLFGEARFIDSHTLNVRMTDGGNNRTERVVQGQTIFINTGGRPSLPKLKGIETIDRSRVLDSTSAQELDALPAHLVVIGGGYVGVEFAQFYHQLGVPVTIVQRAGQLLPREDRDIAQALQDLLREDGLTVYVDATTTSISPSPSSSETFDLAIRFNEGARTITGTHILFAAGRVPNTDMLNLPAAGVKTDSKGFVVVNEYLETSTPSIYALGDVKGPPSFTHISYDDFRILRANLLEAPEARKRSTKDRIVPYVVYSDPQLGHVGLHEQEARAKFPDKKILTATMAMTDVARALETDEVRGLMKAVVDGDTGLILGFTCLAVEGGELMSLVETAMIGDVPYQKLEGAIWSHPTWAESMNNLWSFLK